MRVLVVDDDPVVRRALARMLRYSEPGPDVVTADSGPTAFACLESEPFDVIIADQHMPVMEGAAVLAQVRLRYPKMKRIIMSGDGPSWCDMGEQASAEWFLPKPCGLADLNAVLGAVTGRSA
jgi:CheY-like chemotaxis protein